KSPADRGANAGPLLEIFGVTVLVKVDAAANRVGAVEDRRVAEAHGVALHLRAGHGFGPELLGVAAEGPTFPDIRPARREIGDVEVALIQDDAALETGIGVDAHAEEQTARSRLLDLDENVLECRVGSLVDDADGRPHAGFRVDFEDIEAGQICLGAAELGIAEDIAGGQRNLAQDAALARLIIADDNDLADMSLRGPLPLVN